MPTLSKSPNYFLASLSPKDRGLLRPHLEALSVPLGKFIYKAQDSIERVYFPDTGVISLVVGLTDGRFVEAGMLGRNGVIGAGAPLDGAIALISAVAQVESSGSSVETIVLKRLVRKSERLRISLLRHEQVVTAHTQQVAACNALHGLEQRLSRWLLQTRDLVGSDMLPLKQEFLSQMLGVQRSSVSHVALKLQDAGLIRYRRGRIQVLDAGALKDSCCECYAAINAHFRRLVGWAPSGSLEAGKEEFEACWRKWKAWASWKRCPRIRAARREKAPPERG